MAIVLGDLEFAGAGLVVIAVIGVLISLLLPGLPVPWRASVTVGRRQVCEA
jgi:hypothetical protein